ncbi:hypothetical protein BDV96DRAFT_652372 [Lophiotrema nucula]|uniref:Uncharacterized protein n=1 Tax=Lophiotrema nucula TaxID=690887 RepID=A0A6A5YRQ3_9PLEO|nr:hypothetical protein BDV96DRAFT_652372 [Lophiotrema nucula]
MQTSPDEMYGEATIDPALWYDDATLWDHPQFVDPNAEGQPVYEPQFDPRIDPRLDSRLTSQREFRLDPQLASGHESLSAYGPGQEFAPPKSGLSSYALSLLGHDVPLSPPSQALASQYGSALSRLPLDLHLGQRRQSEALERKARGVPHAQQELLRHVNNLPGDRFAHLHQGINKYAPVLYHHWNPEDDDPFGESEIAVSSARNKNMTPQKRAPSPSIESTPKKQRRQPVGNTPIKQNERRLTTSSSKTPVLTMAALQDMVKTPSSRGRPDKSSTVYSPMSDKRVRKPDAQLRIEGEMAGDASARRPHRKRVRATSVVQRNAAMDLATVNMLETFAAPANVDISQISFEITAEELLTFFPMHTRWPHYLYRLVQNGWEIAHVVGFINMVRNLDPPDALKRTCVGKHLANSDKQIFGKTVGSRSKNRGGNAVEDFTPATWTLSYDRGALTDYYITSLGDGVAIFPTGRGSRLLTNVILHARQNGHQDAKFSAIDSYIEEQGLHVTFPDMAKGNKNEDLLALGRHTGAILEDEERVKQVAETKLAESLNMGGDGRGLKAYLSTGRMNKTVGKTD